MDKITSRRYVSIVLLLISLIALVLLGVSYFVEVQIIVTNPHYGDITETIQLLWRVILATATVGSFAIGVYTLVREHSRSDGLSTNVEIKGTGHDIDVYPNDPVGEQDIEKKETIIENNSETVTETGTEDDTSGTSSDSTTATDEDSKSSIDSEEQVN